MTKFESFRDPAGKVILTDQEVWRLVRADDLDQLKEFLQLDLVHGWQEQNRLISAEAVSEDDSKSVAHTLNGSFAGGHALFRHRRIEFPSFPYEWSPLMLHDAAKLTIEMAQRLLEVGWGLKDATPFNVLFDGPRPVFVDVLSFEKRRPTDPIWIAYNQFVNSFLVPLMINQELRLPLQRIFIANRDGLPIKEAYQLVGRLKRLTPKIFSLITLPQFLSSRAKSNGDLYTQKDLGSAETARFVVKQSLRRLEKQLSKVRPKGNHESDWTGYTEFNQHALPEYMRAKYDFVEKALQEIRPGSVLDVGCNTGLFSFLAAKTGSKVVAIDHDEAVIDRVYHQAKHEKLDVLPLVLNLSRPTPRLGWRYAENPSFLDRAIGRFDAVLMLAVVHHMLVQERIPLNEIFRLAADLTKDALVVEFVPPNDKMFRSLARGRDHLHADLTEEVFVRSAGEFFDVVRSSDLPQTERRIYLLRKKA